jgi:hypothetical protein
MLNFIAYFILLIFAFIIFGVIKDIFVLFLCAISPSYEKSHQEKDERTLKDYS